jgi:hypothetical protein
VLSLKLDIDDAESEWFEGTHLISKVYKSSATFRALTKLNIEIRPAMVLKSAVTLRNRFKVNFFHIINGFEKRV